MAKHCALGPEHCLTCGYEQLNASIVQTKKMLTVIHGIAFNAIDAGPDFDRAKLHEALEDICHRAGGALRWIADQEPPRES